ncbi:glycosyltransferase family 4 protein [Rhizobium sp. LjRoot30]|uniref:glycosyltransferase family 4 protein n=1 Tax=Rhizobium sp. LjRoot30 TaxID=3342320 RepID=UPI003ED14B06
MMQRVSPTHLSILQVLEPSGGGSGRHFIDLCGGLKDRGHRITAVYSPLRAEDRFLDELKALDLPSVHAIDMTRAPGLSDIRSWRQLGSILRREGPFDVVHAHSSKAGALSRIRLPGPHVPRVYTPHAFRTMDPTLGRVGRLVFGGIESLLGRYLSDCIVCVSQDEYDHAVSLGIPAKRLRTVINGTTPPPEGRRDELLQRFAIPQEALVFGFIGRLSQQKAPERLVEAFAKIAGRLPAAHLVMIGFGELEADIRAMIAASGFADRIRLTSEITGRDAISCFDVLVMPSRYEAMSYVMLEAAAAGKPMILSRVGGASRVLEDGCNGILIENSDDTTALAQAMASFADTERRRAFVKEADARKHRYALKTMVDGIEAIYCNLIDPKGARRTLNKSIRALAFEA